MATFKYLTNNDLSLKSIWAWARQLVTDLNSQSASANTGSVPVGTPMLWPTDVIPDGYLLADGGAYLTASQPALFNAYGYRYGGSGDYFNVPDYRNVSLMGAGSIVALGEKAGATQSTLTLDQLPNHDHTVTDPGHTHTITNDAHNHAVTDPGHTHAVTDPGHTHAITDPGHAHANGAANQVTNARTAGTLADVTTQGNTLSNTTGITINSATTGVTNQNATTGVTTNNTVVNSTAADADTGLTVDATGGGQPFSILGPVMGINIIIKA